MITGTLINYYRHCKTQLWLHAHRINLEDNSEDVRIGKVLHEINENKVQEVSLENIKLDKITKEYVVEVKKSDSDIEAAKLQLLYYLYQLKQKGVEKKGRLELFEKNKQDKKIHTVVLDEKEKAKLLKILEEIEQVIDLATPPEPIFTNKCKRCAYYEYCFL